MRIATRIEFVEGEFDTEIGKMICVGTRKYREVSLCFRTDNMHVPFARIKLHSKDLAVDADAVFDDAIRLGKEICARWNKQTPKEGE